MQIMLRHQHRAQYFARPDQVMDISTGPRRAHRAGALVVNRPLVFGKFGVADIDGAMMRKGLAIAARAGGQDAIEHIDAAFDRAHQIVGFAHAHQITWPVGGQLVRRIIEAAKHRLLPFTHRKAAHGIAIKTNVDQRIGRPLAQFFVQ